MLNKEDSLIGATLGGQYEILRRLGEGGMGAVYEAVHQPLGRRVALKVISAELADEQTHIERFRREAAAAAQLGHPNIVQVTDFGIDPVAGRAFLVMELLEGQALIELVKRGPLDPRRACDITMQLLSALHAAHEQGIVHRDLKPANVLLVPLANGSDLVKLVDFGIAKLMDSKTWSKLTQTGVLIGTPRYSAPEQIEERNVGPRTDIYATGVLLYCMLAGRPPFTSNGALLLVDIQQKEAPSPRSFVPELDQTLADIVMRAMEKRPEDRFATAGVMQDALSSWMSGESDEPGASGEAVSPAPPAPETLTAATWVPPGRRQSLDDPPTNIGDWKAAPPVEPSPPPASPRPAVSAVPVGRRWPLLAFAAVVFLLGALALGAGLWLFTQRSSAEPTAEPTTTPLPEPSEPAPVSPSTDPPRPLPAVANVRSSPLPVSCVRHRYDVCALEPGMQSCLDVVRRLDAHAALTLEQQEGAFAQLGSDCEAASRDLRRVEELPEPSSAGESCSPRCDPAEYCREQRCEPRPLLVIETSQHDGCVNLGLSHGPSRFSYRERYFGRPGARTTLTPVNVSCDAPGRPRAGPTLDANGAATIAHFAERDSLDCSGPRATYGVFDISFEVDGELSNAAGFTMHNTACRDEMSTCRSARGAGCPQRVDPRPTGELSPR